MQAKNLPPIAGIRQVVILGLGLLVSHSIICSADRVRLTIDDGRVIEGEIDARTTDQWVWIRLAEPGIALSFPVRWSSLEQVELGGRSVSISEFRGLANQIKSELPHEFFAIVESDEELVAHPAFEPVVTPAQPEIRSVFRNRRVCTLRIDAALTNWDSDVEPDGLDVVIMPLDGRQNLVPVQGSVMMRLIGERSSGPRRERVYQDLQGWSVLTVPGDYGPRGAIYRFPFQTVFPEFEPELFPLGLLHVRLGAQGHGNFEASIAVELRNINPMRDRLVLDHGQRFFPHELTRETRQVFAVPPGARDTR